MIGYIKARLNERSTRLALFAMAGSIVGIIWPEYAGQAQQLVVLVTGWYASTPG